MENQIVPNNQQQQENIFSMSMDDTLLERIDQMNETIHHLVPDSEKAKAMAEYLAEVDTLDAADTILNSFDLWGNFSPIFVEAWNATPQMAASPLDQFAILPLIPMKLGNLYFSFTNPSLFMLLTLSLVLLLLHFVTKKGGGNSVPNVWQSLVELIYDFVLNLVNEQIGGLSGNVKQKFFPCILATFTFLLFRNLQGMIPYSFTVTSHFLITLGLSFSIFIGITIVGFQRNGLHFLSFSLPAGVPLPLAPFLVLLELIPHCFRALSLGIRLFANMMAGHSSVKILSGFAWTMLCMNDLLYFIGDLGPLFIVLALTGLELGVAILQAHVFTILICIYLNDATNLHQNGSFFRVKGGYSVAIAGFIAFLFFGMPLRVEGARKKSGLCRCQNIRFLTSCSFFSSLRYTSFLALFSSLLGT
ncbi:hypothetical protein RND81_12G166000 [Saponaria officinalis]|uniref:F-ATPase protein 6 n=1 Tax=Saponaria officinalis TaxID=3572 RepID=A0AAW1HBF3_SAPOF